jgi:DNA-binding response OmpR family regulator
MKSKVVLIAYQDDSLVKLLSPLSSDPRYRVEVATRVSDILRKMRGNDPDVILLDDEMDGIRAQDLVPLLKKLNSRVQIIAISSEGSIMEMKRLREAGIFYQAMKPADPEEIRSAVACAFDKIRREQPDGSFFQFLIAEEAPV